VSVRPRLVVKRAERNDDVSKELLRDQHGSRIGEIETMSDGKQIIRDNHGTRLGEYSSRDNVTRDKHGSRIGTGNLLTRLLYEK
jgi:hypothetical protein